MPLSNTDIAEQLQAHIDNTQTFITEVIAWSTDEVNTVTFTDPQTQNPITVETLWKIVTTYQNLTGAEWATTPEDVLVPSGNLVDEYSALHWAKKAETAAAGVADVQNQLDQVEAFKNQAETAATNAAASETNAASSASSASTSAANASTSASDAGADASAAAASATLSQDWATKAEDVEVTTGLYSAFHWSKKAEAWAALANPTALDNMSDVNTAAKADGFILFWDQTAGEYQFMDFAHTHVIADVTGLQAALDGKSATGHSHVIGDVTGLQAALDGKSDTGHNHDASYATVGHNHDGTYVQEGAPALDAPVVLQLDSRAARSTGTETVNIDTNSKVYLPVSGNNVTINLVCPASNVMNGVTDIFLTGSILVKATAAITGLAVTTDATDSDINIDNAPSASGDYAVFKYELFKDGTIEYLKGAFV